MGWKSLLPNSLSTAHSTSPSLQQLLLSLSQETCECPLISLPLLSSLFALGLIQQTDLSCPVVLEVPASFDPRKSFSISYEITSDSVLPSSVKDAVDEGKASAKKAGKTAETTQQVLVVLGVSAF